MNNVIEIIKRVEPNIEVGLKMLFDSGFILDEARSNSTSDGSSFKTYAQLTLVGQRIESRVAAYPEPIESKVYIRADIIETDGTKETSTVLAIQAKQGCSRHFDNPLLATKRFDSLENLFDKKVFKSELNRLVSDIQDKSPYGCKPYKPSYSCSDWSENWPRWLGGFETFCAQGQPFDQQMELREAVMLEE